MPTLKIYKHWLFSRWKGQTVRICAIVSLSQTVLALLLHYGRFTFTYRHWGDVIAHSSEIRVTPQILRPNSSSAPCQGHSPSSASLPPMIRLVSGPVPQFGGLSTATSITCFRWIFHFTFPANFFLYHSERTRFASWKVLKISLFSPEEEKGIDYFYYQLKGLWYAFVYYAPTLSAIFTKIILLYTSSYVVTF